MLLRPTDDAAAADVDDSDGCHYERIGVLDPPEPVCLPEVGADLREFRREQARHRCTMLLRCLGGVAISTALIGLFPGMHLAWVFTGLFGLAALGLLGLIAYAKELEAEQARRRTRLDAGRGPHGGVGAPDPATAGYPGAWDDDDFLRGAKSRSSLKAGPRARPVQSGAARSGTATWGPDYPVAAGGVAQLVERYVRNVEAEGSSPFTSTKSPGQRPKVGSPQNHRALRGFA